MPKPSFPPEVRYKDHFTWSWDTAKRRIKEQIVDPVTNLFSKGRDQPIRDSGVPADVTRVSTGIIPEQMVTQETDRRFISVPPNPDDVQGMLNRRAGQVRAIITSPRGRDLGAAVAGLAGTVPSVSVDYPTPFSGRYRQSDNSIVLSGAIRDPQFMRSVLEHESGHAATVPRGEGGMWKEALLSEYQRTGMIPADVQGVGFKDRPATYMMSNPMELAAETFRTAFRVAQSPNTERAGRIMEDLAATEPEGGRGQLLAKEYEAIRKILGRR